MLSDLPHTLYSQGGNKVKQEDIDEATRLTLEAAERRRKERAAEQGYSIEDVFSGKADEEDEDNK